MKQAFWSLSTALILILFSGCGTTSSTTSDPTTTSTTPTTANATTLSDGTTVPLNKGAYTLIAWNDLGMHCMDGNDYSVFSILPPYNNIIAHLVQKGSKPNHIMDNSGITLTYEAVPSLTGKWNTSSSDKTNFWDYVSSLLGVSLPLDEGLKGNSVQSKTPQPLTFDPANNWWKAEGIPVSPKNDDGSYNMYPMVKIVAKDASGNVLADTTTVTPVSDEMDCKKCHSSTSGNAAQPTAGWVSDADPEKDYKRNILRLHDQNHPSAVSSNTAALANKGWHYLDAGLEATAAAGTPILCASCHSSNALPTTGVNNIKPLTQALHGKHASVTDPITNMSLNDSQNRNACYTCHPGADTQCLRGAMGNAKNADGTNSMQCQSCHGTMTAVGSSTREGWMTEPNCQSCHHDGIRDTTAVSNMATGTLKATLDQRFATNANTPSTGKSLYRFSTGHGDIQCSACHGSTHAVYPSSKDEDNIQSLHLQGHTGTVGECTACHTTMPNTTTGGPHGLHSIGDGWVKSHGDVAENGTAQCATCHGADYKGSDLSKMMATRTLNGKSFVAGHKVSCYDCHNGPGRG